MLSRKHQGEMSPIHRGSSPPCHASTATSSGSLGRPRLAPEQAGLLLLPQPVAVALDIDGRGVMEQAVEAGLLAGQRQVAELVQDEDPGIGELLQGVTEPTLGGSALAAPLLRIPGAQRRELVFRLVGVVSLLLTAGLLAAGRALAACTCRCVEGVIQPLCDNTIEIRPICPPTICPITPQPLHRSIHRRFATDASALLGHHFTGALRTGRVRYVSLRRGVDTVASASHLRVGRHTLRSAGHQE